MKGEHRLNSVTSISRSTPTPSQLDPRQDKTKRMTLAADLSVMQRLNKDKIDGQADAINNS